MQPEFDAIGLPTTACEPTGPAPEFAVNRRWHNYGQDIYAGNPEWLEAEHVGVAATMALAEHIVEMHNAALRRANLA
jgi:hypothetical protein